MRTTRSKTPQPRLWQGAWAALAVLAWLVTAAPARAQSGAVTISGRVTAGDSGIVGAVVKVLGLRDIQDTKTRENGAYHLIVPSTQVLGQTVVVEASHRRYGVGRDSIVLKGGPVTLDIVLKSSARQVEPGLPTAASRALDATGPLSPDSVPAVVTKGFIDGTSLTHLAGPMDLPSALAGRTPGFTALAANASGMSSFSYLRGARSISGTVSPLYVIDGIPTDNSGFASTVGEHFGLGGFDMGTPLGGLSLQNIASVTVLSAAEATALYGSRAANGVVLVKTKNGFDSDGFTVFAQRQSTSESRTKLPQYQNQFGQGSGGQFEFFDGIGGGINDGVAESWGPALDGRALAQASYTEAKRAAVRLWQANPSDVTNYFKGGSTVTYYGGAQGAANWGSLRGSVEKATIQGTTPGTAIRRKGGTLSGTARPSPKLFASANLQIVGTNADNRPGTGFDDMNTVASFVTMGRQVDLDSLRKYQREKTTQIPINWIYTPGHNNPSAQSQNTTHDADVLVVTGGMAQYQFAPWLSGALQGGVDHYHRDAHNQVLPGWSGGYPTALGRGDFSGGGEQTQAISANQTLVNGWFAATSAATRRVHGVYTLGLEARSAKYTVASTVADVISGPAGGGGVFQNTESSSGSVVSLYGTAALSIGPNTTLNAGIRRETSTLLPASDNSNLYPSLGGTFDLINGLHGFKSASHLREATLRASWWKAGNETTPRTLVRTYAGQGTLTAPIVGVNTDETLRNETTSGIEIGTNMLVSRSIGLDVAFYHERSSQLLVASLQPVGAPAGPGLTLPLARPTGEVVNKGIELQLRTILLRNFNGLTWDATTTFSKNVNTVEAVNAATNEVPLGPSLWGTSIVARTDSPLGAIVGRRFLRDGSGALLLKNGLPLPDMSPGDLPVLGSWQPAATGSFASTARFHGAELSMLVDAHFGGKLFSATNYWGSYSGTLASTADRPLGGRVMPGIDSTTGTANAIPVTTEAYFHALGAIPEASVYSASFAKLRELRIGYTYRLTRLRYLSTQGAELSLVSRNLWTWAKAPNIDPETTYGVGSFQGVEMGQLPNTRSIGFRISIVP